MQYTGDTTGVSKEVMLTHGNLVVNMLQVHAQLSQLGKDGLPLMEEAQEMMITPPPFYHIYAFTTDYVCMMISGSHNVLTTDPRDIPGFIKELKKWRFSTLLGLSTLFVTLMEHPGLKDIDFSNLKLTNSGGTTLVSATAKRWKDVTSRTVVEGYSLTRCSPVATTSPYGEQTHLGTMGIPIVGTALRVIDEQGSELPIGERGKLYVKGPQIMKGYWQCPKTTEEILDAEGWLRTSDIAVIDENGSVRIVDRKKDLILVSDFNACPNEIEDVVMAHPKVASYTAVGIPDEKSNEAVKLFVVARDPGLSIEGLEAYCKENLTGYGIPRQTAFKDALPMTPVDKILHRELREIA